MYMSHNLNSLKGSCIGDSIGEYYRGLLSLLNGVYF